MVVGGVPDGAHASDVGSGPDRSIPRLIHFIWLGSDPPPRLRVTIERLAVLAPEWEVRLWRDGDLDWLANRRWFEEAPTYAARANIARYEILERFGGLYVDADFEFLRSPSELDFGTSGLALARERAASFNNALMASSPGHPFLRRLVERVGESIDRQPGAPSQKVSGPVLLTKELADWSAESGAKWTEIGRDVVYPYSFDKLDRGQGPWSPCVVAVHHWAQARDGRAWVPSNEPHPNLRQRMGPLTARALSRLRPRSRLRSLARRVGLTHRHAWRPNGVALGDSRTLTVLRSGRSIVFDADDNIQRRYLAIDGGFDIGFQCFLTTTLSGSDVYVDVGANIGQFVSAAMWSLSDFGRVFAFEPNPRLAGILRENERLQRSLGARAEVVVHEVAVSDRAGHAVLHVPRSHAGRGTLWSTTVGDVDRSMIDEVSVEVVRLDDVLDHLSHIRLLKVDVEGNEPNVLAGAAGLIESGRVDFVDLEVVRRHLGPRFEALQQILEGWERHGVTFWRIDRRGRRRRHRSPIGEVLASTNHGHLVADTRVFGERARAGAPTGS